jgi:chaperone required for assembly of F1-ATPase
MKRFYQTASVGSEGGGYTVLLDGRSVKTRAKATLLLPNTALARAVAAEWDAQVDQITPDAMPLTRLVTTATDRMPALRAAARNEIADYGGTDLLCYRATEPDPLVERQHHAWQPHLDWLERDLGIRLEVTGAMLPLSQDPAMLQKLRQVIEGVPDWPLVGLHAATTGLGSVVLGLALMRQQIDAETAADASLLDELFEIERWGEEREASRRHAALRRDVAAADLFLRHVAAGNGDGDAGTAG